MRRRWSWDYRCVGLQYLIVRNTVLGGNLSHHAGIHPHFTNLHTDTTAASDIAMVLGQEIASHMETLEVKTQQTTHQ